MQNTFDKGYVSPQVTSVGMDPCVAWNVADVTTAISVGVAVAVATRAVNSVLAPI